MPYPSVKRGWKADEEQGGSDPPPPPAYTEVKKTRSLSPSAEPDEGRVVWSNSDVHAELAKGLGPEYVSSRKGPAGAGDLSYLSTNDCIDLLNRIFGSDRWSHSIIFHHTDLREQSNKWIADATCIVRITVRWPDGATSFHEGKGYGGNKGLKTRGEAVEGAEKEAESDALKRAARNFGSATGNCLYDKQFVTHLKKVKYDEKNKASPKRWTAESLLRKASLDDGAEKQQKLSFQSTASHVPRATGGTLKTLKASSPPPPPVEDYFKSDDDEDGLFVKDDEFTEF